uniref:Reverse transcriptase domain-containing protein n=1 Tax=Tanacetum cinerariifolium TaxID=118510 RepID=A0A699I986_TANCI|nr:reverse transcriptase domain-containing protein [Tanacetum cinerariifolium]
MSAPFVSSLRRDVRGGEESAQLSRISDLLDTVVLSNMGDRWFWDLNGDGCFRVKDVCRMLDDMLLPKFDVPSRWVKQIPIKVNVLAWKISMDRLPTQVNLHRRGVQVSPISFPIYCEALENLDHLLFCCDLAKDIARSICNWWGLVWNPVDSYRSWLSWFNLVQLQSSSKQCTRIRNSYFPNNSSVTILRRRNKRRTPNIVEPELCTIVEVTPMADNRTMEELLQAPTEGYGEAIVIPEINADHFEIKSNLLQLVQANPYHGFERENPHTHINNFKRITSTLKFRDVSNDVIKLMMFPYSLEGSARIWYDKEPPNSILTWEDLINKFVNQFFPPSKTTHLKNEISRFTQRFQETFGEAWERFKEMLRACPHNGFTKLAQIDTFYNGLNDNDQDTLNVAAGGNLLSKTTREALQIIKNKSKVRYSRNKPNVSRMNTTSRENDSGRF